MGDGSGPDKPIRGTPRLIAGIAPWPGCAIKAHGPQQTPNWS